MKTSLILLCLIAPVHWEIPVFIGKNQKGRVWEDRGAKRSPYLDQLGMKTRLWRGLGVARCHTLGVLILGFSISFYLLLDFQILVLDLPKSPLIFGFNQLICIDFVLIACSTDFIFSDLPWSVLIFWFRINSKLNYNFDGLLGCFSSLSFSNGPAFYKKEYKTK